MKDDHGLSVRKTGPREGQDPELSRRMCAKGVVDSPRGKEGYLSTKGLKTPLYSRQRRAMTDL